ncbi:MAG: hypothetical protein IPL79_11540 [Myxococcales bacterium]|nr:hypothetical protein [Myxococcales bacterium]
MPPAPYPHRVCVLPSLIVGTDGTSKLEGPIAEFAARVLGHLMCNALVAHPVCAVFDASDEPWTDPSGQLLNARHADFDDVGQWHFQVNRRHELLWLEWPLGSDAVRLHSRRPVAGKQVFAGEAPSLAASLNLALSAWLDARHLSETPQLHEFSGKQLVDATTELATAKSASSLPSQLQAVTPYSALATPLATACLQALAQLRADWRDACFAATLRRDPTHVAARYHDFLLGLRTGATNRREIFSVIEDAPMYGKAHLAVWGEAFAAANKHGLSLGLRHQGVAASLLPANPVALHNYATELARQGRYEEAFRWAQRAAEVSPTYFAAHLDCVRFALRSGRPGHALAEAQFRYGDVLEGLQSAAGKQFDAQAKFRAGMLLAEAMMGAGRYDEAVARARSVLADMPADLQPQFAEESAMVTRWTSDLAVVAHADLRAAHVRGDLAMAVRIHSIAAATNARDAAIAVEALLLVGREDQALVCGEVFLAKFGSEDEALALIVAKLHLLRGELARAVDLIQAVELRRPNSRRDAEINRLWRLAAIRDPKEWDDVLRRLLGTAALRRAQMLARDLADFVPGVDAALIETALGARPMFSVDPAWFAGLRVAMPDAAQHIAAIDERLALPVDVSLAAADRLVQDWWKALPSRSLGPAHAAATLYALAISLARYLSLTSGKPTPLAGAYRHIATEALHLLRRARFELDDWGARGLLELIEACKPTQEWLLDTWLLRIERTLDLEAARGALLIELTAGLPTVASLLRGDERAGWELRMADDLRTDASAGEPAAFMLARCARSLEGGYSLAAWSDMLGSRNDAAALDVHWLAATASNAPGPWLHLMRALSRSGLPKIHTAVVSAAINALELVPVVAREALAADIAEAWPATGVPHHRDAATTFAREAETAGDAASAILALRWVLACDPTDKIARQTLTALYLREGQLIRAARHAIAICEADAPWVIDLYRELGHHAELVALLWARLPAATTVADVMPLIEAAQLAGDPDVAIIACERALALGGEADVAVLFAHARALIDVGEWQRAHVATTRLIASLGSGQSEALRRAQRLLAHALAGLSRFEDAQEPIEAAIENCPPGDALPDYLEVLRLVQSRQVPESASTKWVIERRAYSNLLRGGRKRVQDLAASGNSWALFRAALAATLYRSPEEGSLPVTSAALHAAKMVLERSAGTTHRDGVLCRLDALLLRDQAYLHIDVAPPVAASVDDAVVHHRLGTGLHVGHR